MSLAWNLLNNCARHINLGSSPIEEFNYALELYKNNSSQYP